MDGASGDRRRYRNSEPVPLLWVALNLLVMVLGVAVQIAWVYSGPELCPAVMPPVENCSLVDRWQSVHRPIMVVALVAIVAILATAVDSTKRWRASCLLGCSLATILVVVLATR